ncbi:GAF domain-containing protein [Sabulicella rubraurantiaca]|uniref:GAF domain-containing protein n=1 Tax=Sabulicella rubraurantiaca TaxID=2811429 RepID=UPI001A95F547|nr:GAF domain-containing protein [Sabulicella rubraurantiaca]
MQLTPGSDAHAEGLWSRQRWPAGVTDPQRLDALDSHGILDTPPEQGFDDIVRLATRLCAAPVALVSLVDADRQWFKARIGFPHCETDLNRSVCAHALSEPDLLVIPDLTTDPRTAGNPLVTDDPRIRFYAGAPLRTPEGQVLGSLCVIDTVPRPDGLSTEQAEDLRTLADQVMALLALRRAIMARDQAINEQRDKLRQARRLDVVAQASVALATAIDPAAVLEPILAAGAESVGFEQCFIYELTPDADHLRLVRSVGVDEATKAILDCSHIDEPLCGIVVQTRRPLILRDVQSSTDPRYALARQTGINGFAGYPIVSRGDLVGVISFATRAPGFDADALSFFATMAALVSGVRERLDGEEAVRESDTRSRLAQEAGRVGIFEVDIASGLAKVSPELCRIYGLAPARIYAVEKFTSLVVPEDRNLPSSERTRQDGSAAPDVRYRIRRANDGAIRWVERKAKFVCLHDGTPARMFGTVQDITDQQTVLEELTRTEEQLRLAAEATGLGIFDLDLVTGVLRWDTRVRELFGVGPNAPVTYDTFLEGVHPEDRAAADAAVQGALDPTGPGVFETEYRVRPANGAAELWLAARGQAVVRNDRTVRFVGTVRDITASRQAEDTLRTTEERHRLAVRATNDAVWDWDLLANTVLWNEALTEAHGHSLAAVQPTGE